MWCYTLIHHKSYFEWKTRFRIALHLFFIINWTHFFIKKKFSLFMFINIKSYALYIDLKHKLYYVRITTEYPWPWHIHIVHVHYLVSWWLGIHCVHTGLYMKIVYFTTVDYKTRFVMLSIHHSMSGHDTWPSRSYNHFLCIIAIYLFHFNMIYISLFCI